MEFDKWTREYVDVLCAIGFERRENKRKATTHVTLVRRSAGGVKAIRITVPTRIPDHVRHNVIASAIKACRHAGMSADEFAPLRQVRFGYIIPDPTDGIDELERKLSELVIGTRDIELAAIAMRIGVLAATSGQRDYESPTLIIKHNVAHERPKIRHIIDDIADIIECRVKKAISVHIERNGWLVAYLSRKAIDPLDRDIAAFYGVELIGVELTSDSSMLLHGVLNDVMVEHLPDRKRDWRFSIEVMIDGISDPLRIMSSDRCDSLHLETHLDEFSVDVWGASYEQFVLANVEWRLKDDRFDYDEEEL